MTPRSLRETTEMRSPAPGIAGYHSMEFSDANCASRRHRSINVSDIAGELSGIVAALHLRAELAGDEAEADRFDIGIQSIYFASLLLAVDNDTGLTRTSQQMLAALTTVGEVVAELKDWLHTQQ